nr:hypothetical protein [Bacilli bacterium]
MVKRQTVWLSTMMILSLMLIGYYTLGTPPITTHSNLNATTTKGTTVVTKSIKPSQTVVASQSTSHLSPSDWFVQTELDEQNKQQRLMQTYENTMSDPRASNAVVTTAYQQLTSLQTQQVNATRVHDELVGEGYPDSIVIFNPNHTVTVYVEAQQLSPTAAVNVINLVSETLGTQSNQIVVTPHA